jgi:proteasome beta subunit
MIENQWYKKIENMVLKGTTTIGIVCRDGIVLATDTRVTMGYFIAHKHGKKVYRLDDHLAITIAGVVADAQNVVEILKANASLFFLNKGRRIPVSAAARLAANILFSSRGYPLIMQALVGGVDDNGSHVFSIDPFGSVIEETCVSTGSGSPIAYGVLEDGYSKELSIEEGKLLVIRAVTSAMKRDAGSGDSFDVVTITDKEGYKELSDKEKHALMSSA